MSPFHRLAALALFALLGASCAGPRTEAGSGLPTITGSATFPSSGGVLLSLEISSPEDVASVELYAGSENGPEQVLTGWKPSSGEPTYEASLEGEYAPGSKFYVEAELSYASSGSPWSSMLKGDDLKCTVTVPADSAPQKLVLR